MREYPKLVESLLLLQCQCFYQTSKKRHRAKPKYLSAETAFLRRRRQHRKQCQASRKYSLQQIQVCSWVRACYRRCRAEQDMRATAQKLGFDRQSSVKLPSIGTFRQSSKTSPNCDDSPDTFSSITDLRGRLLGSSTKSAADVAAEGIFSRMGFRAAASARRRVVLRTRIKNMSNIIWFQVRVLVRRQKPGINREQGWRIEFGLMKIGCYWFPLFQHMRPKVQGTIVCKNYRLMRKLGKGTFGDIYLAVSIHKETEKLAAKLEETSARHPQLCYQAKLYQLLNKEPQKGFSKMHAFSVQGTYNVMLLDLLGKSLEDLLQEQGKGFSIKTVTMLGLQILDRIQYLHSKDFIHRDIKPENFLMGTGAEANTLYMIDLGLAKRFIKDGTHMPYKDGQDLIGTIRYVSINTHYGIQQSRRDDLESIGYVLAYLLKGTLPWNSIKAMDVKQKQKMIMDRKISISPEELLQGFPQQFAIFIKYARGLKFDELPNYNYLRELLESVRAKENIEIDWIYDWSKIKQTSTVKIGVREPRIMNSPDEQATKKKTCGRRETGNSMDIQKSNDSRNKLDMNFGSSNKQRFRGVLHQDYNKQKDSPRNMLLQKSPSKDKVVSARISVQKD